MIDYLTWQDWLDFNPYNVQTGQAAAGMAQKTYRVLEALNLAYHTRGINYLADSHNKVIVIEPLWFLQASSNSEPRDLEEQHHIIDELQERRDNGCNIVLLCSELTMLALPPVIVERIKHLVDAVTVNCEFQKKLFAYVDIKPQAIVCDPIPDIFFKSGGQQNRQLKIVSGGNISYNKNSEFLIDIYQKLGEIDGLTRTYLGSSQLWSHWTRNDELDSAMQENCDNFIELGTPYQVAHEFQTAVVGIWTTHHDCFSQVAHEMLAAGLPLIAGDHGLVDELPMYSIIQTVDDAVRAVEAILDEVDVDNWESMSHKNYEWSIENVSYDAFIKQFQSIISGLSR